VQAFRREELEIEARQVSRKEIQRIIDISGTLLPNEEVVVSSEVEGPVEKVLVDLGDRVNRGQLLVKISAREFELSVDRYLAVLQQALARLGLNEENEQLRSDGEATEVRHAAAQIRHPCPFRRICEGTIGPIGQYLIRADSGGFPSSDRSSQGESRGSGKGGA
jgi:hypothetical protein